MKKAPLGKEQNVAVPPQNLAIDPRGKSSLEEKEFIFLRATLSLLKELKLLELTKNLLKLPGTNPCGLV